MNEWFDLCHLPRHDALGGKGTKRFTHLIFRLGFNYEGSGESTEGDASRTDLAILSKTFERWDDEFLESLDRLLVARWNSC